MKSVLLSSLLRQFEAKIMVSRFFFVGIRHLQFTVLAAKYIETYHAL